MQSKPSSPFELRGVISREYAVFAEYLELCRRPCDGIFAIPSESSPLRWLGAASVNDGPYDGGIFRFELTISEGSSPPSIYFRPPIYHPMVDPNTGEFNCSLKFIEWKAHNRVRDVLEFLRQSLIAPDLHLPSNPAAAALLASDPRAYRTLVRKDIARISELLASEEHTPPTSRLSFGSWIPDIHQPVRERMLENKSINPKPA